MGLDFVAVAVAVMAEMERALRAREVGDGSATAVVVVISVLGVVSGLLRVLGVQPPTACTLTRRRAPIG